MCERNLQTALTDTTTKQDVRSMLKQAIGLAKYMGRAHVVAGLEAVLDDPTALRAISDDSMTV